jgi:hypothetical protein
MSAFLLCLARTFPVLSPKDSSPKAERKKSSSFVSLASVWNPLPSIWILSFRSRKFQHGNAQIAVDLSPRGKSLEVAWAMLAAHCIWGLRITWTSWCIGGHRRRIGSRPASPPLWDHLPGLLEFHWVWCRIIKFIWNFLEVRESEIKMNDP